MSNFDFDHLVIFVDDLEQATQDYVSLGFKVSLGGSHKFGTFNNLIYLQDGKYLELVSYPGGYDALERVKQERVANNVVTLQTRWVNSQRRNGTVDFAVRLMQVDEFTIAVQRANMNTIDGSRRSNLSDVEIKWKMGIPAIGSQLPFLITDVTDRSLRVLPESNAQPNGVTGISRVTFVVPDSHFDQLIIEWKELFGSDCCSSISDLCYAFKLHSCELLVQRADENNRDHLEHLAFAGDYFFRPFQIHLKTNGPSDKLVALNKQLAHNVCFVFM